MNSACPDELFALLDDAAGDLEVDIFLLMEQADQQYFDPRCLFSDDVCDPSGSDSVGPLDRILNAHCDDGAESDSDLESVPRQFVLTVQDILCNWTVVVVVFKGGNI